LKINRIFLDLDDVCNEFTLQALATFGCNICPGEYGKYKPEWGFDILKAAGELQPPEEASSQFFWETFGRYFWSGLPESREFEELIELAEDIVGFENTLILTAPICSPEPDLVSDRWRETTSQCLAGKYNWIIDHFPNEMHRNFSMCPVKHLCAAPDALLIDDSNKNVSEFKAAGGQTILMPRPWNNLHYLGDSMIMTHVYSRLAEILQA